VLRGTTFICTLSFARSGLFSQQLTLFPSVLWESLFPLFWWRLGSNLHIWKWQQRLRWQGWITSAHVQDLMAHVNLVPRAPFPLTSSQKRRALGASIAGMRHRYHRCRLHTAQWNRMCRIRLFPLLFENGCSQSSCFPTTVQAEWVSGNEIGMGLRWRQRPGVP